MQQQQNISELRHLLHSGLPLPQPKSLKEITKVFTTLKHVSGQPFIVTGEDPANFHQKHKGTLTLSYVNFTPIGVVAGLINNSGHPAMLAGKRINRAIVYIKEHETFRRLFSGDLTAEKRQLLNESILLSITHEHVLESGPAKELFMTNSCATK